MAVTVVQATKGAFVTLWHVLTKHRAIPAPPAWLCAVFFLGTGLYAGGLAISPEPPPWGDDLNVHQILEEQKECAAAREAVMRAVESDDQDLRQAAFRRCESLQKTHDERKARRQADLEARVRAQRAKLGAYCVTAITTAIWYCLRARGFVSRGSGSRRVNPHAIGS